MKKKVFKCEACRKTFIKGLSDDVANKEAEELWGIKNASEDASMALICEDCFQAIIERTRKHIHLWKKVGSSSGQDMGDIDYKCGCGSQWKVEIPIDIYWEMPNEIQGKELAKSIEVNTPFGETL